jgi:2-keto-4-pentenoate hydratase/2-oxohepta-3-ene-1,7-dioic acid hydratase in catechol pathway
MRIVRYRDPSGDISYASEQSDGTFLRMVGDVFENLETSNQPAKIDQRLAPVPIRMIWCVGKNYWRHAHEVGMSVEEFPVLFSKGVNSVQDPGEPIFLPDSAGSGEVDYEGELVVIISKPCRNVTRDRALDYVWGYTCGNDVSARDWQLQKGGGQWIRGKSFDTFAPLGPCLVTRDEIPDPGNLRLQTRLNGAIVQEGNTRDMIFDVPTLISFLSESTTLLPGTAIFSGTPHGVGMARNPPLWLKEGDEVSVIIERIGTLTNPVAREPRSRGTGSQG